MTTIDNDLIQAKRAEAQQIDATLHVGKAGIVPTLVDELAGQLKRRKLVKVRLLPAATEGGAGDRTQAQSLADATASTLIEVRGHTAVFWKP